MPAQHRILALAFNDFEALDLFGPLSAIIPRSDYYTLQLVNVHNSSVPFGLECSIKNGLGILLNSSLAKAAKDEEPLDTLFIPGGFGVKSLVGDPRLLQQVSTLVDRAPNVFTVCTGSNLLAATGRLDGRKATTNKRRYDENSSKYPGVDWQRRARSVQDGKFLTSSGVTAGMDAGFALLSNTCVTTEDRKAHPTPQEASTEGDATEIPGFDRGKALSHTQSIAFCLEYRWHPDPTDDPFVALPQSTEDSV